MIQLKDIEQLWLIQRSGVPMFKYPENDQKIDDSLFAGMLTAILQLVRTSMGHFIETIAMGDRSFCIVSVEELDLIIVVQTPKNIKSKQVHKQLEVIREKLMKTYTLASIKNWDGSCEFFKSFTDQLKEEKESDPVNLFFGTRD
ncbi:MAG: hypothetical protein RBG13Loki_4373 [Promethearchaeota archaeon CR_4]|nr:MAG: hypothetical protein RBG13Loki_4373 [Candidatus Lokiarchaeota archaeon CR_4]